MIEIFDQELIRAYTSAGNVSFIIWMNCLGIFLISIGFLILSSNSSSRQALRMVCLAVCMVTLVVLVLTTYDVILYVKDPLSYAILEVIKHKGP